MNWNELKPTLDVLESGAQADPVVTDVVYDSRKAGPGAVFVAIDGLKEQGERFVADALARGAVAVISEKSLTTCTVPWARVANARVALGQAAGAVWGVNLADSTVIGVTGTNGKTTVATMLHRVLATLHGEESVWMTGTITYIMGQSRSNASRTTPEAADIFRAIGTAAAAPRALVMEVSSHALQLERVAGLAYTMAIWTNLTQDHLDFHESMEQYYQAKKLLFTRYLTPGGSAVINIDDPWGKRLAGERATGITLTYGESESADIRIVRWESAWTGSRLDLTIKGKPCQFTTALTGGFNRYNLAAVVAAAVAMGIDVQTLEHAIADAPAVQGRMERVELDAPFTVVVDYAHTPDALEKLLLTVREITKGTLVCVFGCGGDRDKGKRSLMGEVVVKGADEAYVTSDNPRTENSQAIIDDILAAMPLDYPHQAVVDRSLAIRRALDRAAAGDCVVIAGKGHETYQEIKGVRTPFDDRDVVRRQYAAIVKERSSHDC